MSRKIYRLHDSVIAAIARSLQQALLTGTDISDHMRMMRLEEMRDDPDTLVMTEEYLKQENETHERMIAEAEQISADAESSKESGDEGGVFSDVPPGMSMFADGRELTGDGGDHGPN